MLCAVLVAAFQWLVLEWSVTEPPLGSDPFIPPPVSVRAQIASSMALPFAVPLLWLVAKMGFGSWIGVAQWVALPMVYGSAIYVPIGFWIREKTPSPA